MLSSTYPTSTPRTKANFIALNRQGTTGILDGASNSQLENEFGTHKEEEVVKQILEKGDIQESEVRLIPIPAGLRPQRTRMY